jgi:hypothetical protein
VVFEVVFVSELGVVVLLLLLFLVGEVGCVEGVLVEAVWWVEVSRFPLGWVVDLSAGDLSTYLVLNGRGC